MQDLGINKLNKGERVAVFVAISVTILLFIVPSFEFFGTNPSSVQFVEQALNRTEELSVYEIKPGSGLSAEEGDILFVHYEGKFPDGSVFDSSYGTEPFEFVLGQADVIAGWDIGLRGMREGGSRILVVPPKYGYGNVPIGIIPADSTLVFDVELIKVQKRIEQ